MKEKDIFWYDYNLSDELEQKKVVKILQKICRQSIEYNTWQLRTKSGEKRCPVCSEYYGYVPSETHHYPATMYDICDEVLQTHILDNGIDDRTSFDLCNEIMNLHYINQVQFVVLCKACHEKFHAGHPEVCTKVSEIYDLKQKGIVNKINETTISKPTEQTESTEQTKPELFIDQDETVRFINNQGILIDI